MIDTSDGFAVRYAPRPLRRRYRSTLAIELALVAFAFAALVAVCYGAVLLFAWVVW